MKQCPSCQTKYTDETLRFCLQDGTPLIALANPQTEMPTISFTDSETIVSPRQVERLDIPVEKPNTREWEESRQISEFQPEEEKSNTFLIAAVSALVTVLLLGGAVGMWFFLKKDKPQTAQNNKNKSAVNQNVILPENVNKEVSPSSEDSSPSPTSTPSAMPTAAPAPNFNPEQVQREVSEKVNAWIRATESGNSNAIANNYADTVDYYNKRKVSLNYVRKDKQKAFSKFDYIKMDISNLRITPDASGERATAVFDKEWTFEGEEGYSAGKVQSQLQLQKFNGRWLITGEKDLKIYYTE